MANNSSNTTSFNNSGSGSNSNNVSNIGTAHTTNYITIPPPTQLNSTQVPAKAAIRRIMNILETKAVDRDETLGHFDEILDCNCFMGNRTVEHWLHVHRHISHSAVNKLVRDLFCREKSQAIAVAKCAVTIRGNEEEEKKDAAPRKKHSTMEVSELRASVTADNIAKIRAPHSTSDSCPATSVDVNANAGVNAAAILPADGGKHDDSDSHSVVSVVEVDDDGITGKRKRDEPAASMSVVSNELDAIKEPAMKKQKTNTKVCSAHKHRVSNDDKDQDTSDASDESLTVETAVELWLIRIGFSHYSYRFDQAGWSKLRHLHVLDLEELKMLGIPPTDCQIIMAEARKLLSFKK